MKHHEEQQEGQHKQVCRYVFLKDQPAGSVINSYFFVCQGYPPLEFPL